MTQYWLGLATIPAVIAVGAALFYLIRGGAAAYYRWWTEPSNKFDHDDWESRANHAAGVFAAKRVWGCKLPCARIFIVRSAVGLHDFKYGKGWSDTLDITKTARAVLLDEFDPR